MNDFWRRCSAFGLWMLLCGFLPAALPSSPTLETPTADEIVSKLLEASARLNKRWEKQTISYSKVAVMEQVDQKGNSKDREEKLYRITFRQGKIKMRLMALNGKVVDAYEKAPDLEKETDLGKAPQGEERPLYLTPAIMARYQFTLLGEEESDGRKCHLLHFEPKADLKDKGLVDRFLNHMTGRIWVDAAEHEIARAEVRLGNPVTLWGGVLGALKRFDYKLERTRLESGLWFNRTSSGDFELRKFLSAKRFRTASEWKDVLLEAKL